VIVIIANLIVIDDYFHD